MLEPTCVEGSEVEVGGELVCVVEQPVVVETGFDCPADMPFMHEVNGISVCSSSSDPPVDLLGDLLPFGPPPPDGSEVNPLDDGATLDTSAPVESASFSGSSGSTGSSESDDDGPEDESDDEPEDESDDEPEDESDDEPEEEEEPEDESDDEFVEESDDFGL